MQVSNIARIVDSKPVHYLIGLGLLLVVALALGACGSDDNQPAAAEPTATEAAAEPTATTAAAEPTATTAAVEPEATATAAVTETEGMTGTEGTTATEGVTDTEEMTGTEGVTETEGVTGTEGVTEGEEAGEAESTEAITMASAGDPANGEYLVTLSGGCGCHFNSDLGGLAGGRKFEGPFGVVYSKNLTPDEETGIASVTDETLVGLIRTGQQTVDGETMVLSPIMPYHTFSILSDTDAQDIVAYLRTLEPIRNAVPERELTEEPEPFTPEVTPPAEAPTDPVARGEYLVTLATCGRCHSPKNEDGSEMQDMVLAGAPMTDDSGETAANITPDEETGIGSRSEEDIAHFLLTGMKPNGDQVEGAMAQQIERRFSNLTEEDAAAIAAYLKSIPAISNDPSAQ